MRLTPMDLALEVFPPFREELDHGTFPYVLAIAQVPVVDLLIDV